MTIKTVETENQGLKRAFMLTIPAEDIEARVDQEVKRIAPQIRMPGFRPGKVPPNLIRKMHGDSLRGDALNTAVQDGVQQLLSEKNIRPALQPQVELDQAYEPGKDAEITVRLEALPDVPAPQIDGLALERLAVDTDENAVDEQIKQLASGNKNWEDAPKKHVAADGDLVVIDFEGKVDGTPFEGGKGEDMSVELGSGRLIPGFEEQLVGAKSGDTRDLNVTFPADYPVADLKGKDATFSVTVKGVKTAGESKIDEDFAKSLGLESLAKLREMVKERLTREHAGMSRQKVKRKLLDELDAKHKFTAPPTLVDDEFTNVWKTIIDDLQSRKRTFEDEDTTEEKAKEEYRGIAERRVRLGLVLAEIGEKNNIKVADDELSRAIVERARQVPGREQEVWDYYRKNPQALASVRAPLFEEKVVDFLVELAKVTDKQVSREELYKEDEDSAPAT